MKPCRVCGSAPRLALVPGKIAALRMLLGPRWRAVPGGYRDWVCWRCALWAARAARIVA